MASLFIQVLKFLGRKAWAVQKTMFDLKHTRRTWYDKINVFFCLWLQHFYVDNNLDVFSQNGFLCMNIKLHVNDLLITGRSTLKLVKPEVALITTFEVDVQYMTMC